MPQDVTIIQPRDAFQYFSNLVGENNTESPNYHHPEYEKYRWEVERCEDFYEGRSAWISGFNNSDIESQKLVEYLPKAPAEESEEYFDRARRTLFHNYFKPSVNMFAALVSKFDFTDNVSQAILDNQQNVDLCGSDLGSFKHDADTKALRDGFVVIVVSYPAIANSSSRPYLNLIQRDDLINWDYEYSDDGMKKMTLAVIKRKESEKINRFASKEVDVRWIYSLDDNGFVQTEKFYRQTEKFYQQTESSKPSRLDRGKTTQYETWVSYAPPQILRDINQQPLTEIPIVIYSVSDRDAICEAPPLLDLLEKVKCHYQVYSDYQRTIYKLQPTYVRTWSDFIPENPPAMTIGSSLAIEAANGATISVLQIDPSSVAPMREMLIDLRADIKSEALSFLGQSTVQQTDDEIALKMAQGKASLRKFALLQKSLWQQVFSYWDKWLGIEANDGTIEVDINVLDKPVTPQEVQIILDAVSSGTMDSETASTKLHQLRWLPEDLKLTAIAPTQTQSSPQANNVVTQEDDDPEENDDPEEEDDDLEEDDEEED